MCSLGTNKWHQLKLIKLATLNVWENCYLFHRGNTYSLLMALRCFYGNYFPVTIPIMSWVF